MAVVLKWSKSSPSPPPAGRSSTLDALYSFCLAASHPSRERVNVLLTSPVFVGDVKGPPRLMLPGNRAALSSLLRVGIYLSGDLSVNITCYSWDDIVS